jgi:hypothetical protein
VPPLPVAVATVIRACLAFAQGGGLDLVGEFARMVHDADGFLVRAHPGTTQPGEFSTHERDGDRVRKRLDADHLTGRDLPFPGGAAGAELGRYLDTLRTAGVQLPADLAVTSGTPLMVTHTWLDGPTLAEAATTDPAGFVTAVREITCWLRALDGTDARIDANLANFCLTHGRPTLVDVLPPLIVSRRPVARNLFEELFDSLCFDTAVTLDALLAYALTRLLTSGPTGWAAAGALAELADGLVSTSPGPGLAASWFRARLLLAMRCTAGQAALNDLRVFSATTSVLTFHRLDERARHERTAAVRQQIHDLGLVGT